MAVIYDRYKSWVVCRCAGCVQVGGSAPASHCSAASESESGRSGGIQRLSPSAEVGQAPRRRPVAAERVSSPGAGNAAARSRAPPKTSCCCYRCCFCWRCQCNGSVYSALCPDLLARDAQAKLALIVAQCLSIHLSICVSVRDSLSHACVRSIARREPHRLPACFTQKHSTIWRVR